ncbi:Crp/Fnr family transcriptional regulator [Emticicia fluvialis]|uniref:Crp/Fnr family transcriptional regulator n=1 Tax=Emticicia fluvialis TaxID=2974474 RepID=UPI0021663490|nr:Crp/Fnr family transcriptional regulator [Emticicia fluvialis]
MENALLKFLSKFETLTQDEAESIADKLQVQTYKKGTLLLKEGEIAKRCFFILKGCVRQYYLADGDEKTTAFFTEEQAVVSFSSYARQIPSTQNWICAEDTTAIVGYLDAEQEMYAQFPKLLEITRAFLEVDFGKTQDDFATFVASSPEERYNQLQEKRPGLLQRVPQHQIASYLGIKPESLSRIRKRLSLRK